MEDMQADHELDDAQTLASYGTVLQNLTQARKNRQRDPRALRLAAVTAAVVDLVDKETDNGGDSPSASQVYAKTVTALEGTLSASSERLSNPNGIADSLATQVALLELLNTTVPHVEPTALLRATLPVTSRVLRAIVSSLQSVEGDGDLAAAAGETKDELGGVNAVLRGCCRASAQFLRCLPNDSDHNQVHQLYAATIVGLWDDRRPKVRKAAQNSAMELLTDPSRHVVFRKVTHKYFHNALVRAQRKATSQSADDAFSADASTTLMHALQLLEKCIMLLGFEVLSKDVMELLTLMFQKDATSAASDFVAMVKVNKNTSNSRALLIQSLLSVVLHALDEDNQNEQHDNILQDWSSRVLASLLTAKPALIFRPGSASDELLERGRSLYGRSVIAATRRVLRNENRALANKLLPLSIQMVLLLSKPSNSSDEDIDEDDWEVANALFVDLTQLFRTSLVSFFEASKGPELQQCTKESLESIGAVLRPEYQPCWSVSLKALVVFLEKVLLGGASATPETQSALTRSFDSLLNQHSQERAGSPSQRNVEDAVSTLVQGIGLEQTWSIILWPDVATTGIPNDRAWILTTLKSAALTAQPTAPRLSFFQQSILGMARSLDRLATNATTKKKESLFHRARVMDLWNLLPCFCNGAADIAESLPPLTAILCKAMEDDRYPNLVSVVARALTKLAESVSDGNSTDDSAALSQASQKLLPILFKLIASPSSPSSKGESMDVDASTAKSKDNESDRGQQVQVLCAAIAQLSRHAPSKFLHALFKKLMHRLLDEIQSESRDEENICAFLSLSQALVASQVLDESNVSFLYRTIKPFIRTDEYGPRCQKKAYKVMAELCERNQSFFSELDRLKEMTELLAGAAATSQVAARHMRLKCLKHIVDGLNPSQVACLAEIDNVLAENLLCLKDTNAKTREAAYQLLLASSSKNQLTQFLQTLTAALGAETPHMRSAAVMALSRIVFENAWEDENLQGLLPSLLSTVLVLMNENSREVIKSVVGFIRVSVAAIPREQLEPLLPELIQSLLGYHKTKDRFRSKIKIILKKLVKQFGYEMLMPHVPESETRLLTHMRKLDERRKRRKEALKDSEKPNEDMFDDMVESDEEDSDDGRTLATGLTGFTRMTSRSSMLSKKQEAKSMASKSKRTGASASAFSNKTRQTLALQLPDETDGEVVDMLGANMAKRVKFMDDGDSINDDDSGGELEFDDEGRLVIEDEGDFASMKSKGDTEQPVKKQRTSKFESAKIQRNQRGRSTKTKQLGAAYKSKKAGGDVKRKDQKFEPYAFLPLDGKNYSKKNRRNAVDSMNSVVRQGKKRKSH